jgi:hypothetical protein
LNNEYLIRALFFVAVPIVLILATSTHTLAAPSLMDSVKVNRPQLVDARGQTIETLKVGQQAVIRIVLQNYLESVQSFVALIEIRDVTGVTQYLAWQSGKLSIFGNYTFETSWIPTNGCFANETGCTNIYEIRAFVLSDLENPQVLSQVMTRQPIEVIQTEPRTSEIYMIEWEGNLYRIEYFLHAGDVEEIIADPSLATISVQLEKIITDTRLELTLPKSLIPLLFLDSRIEPTPGGSTLDPIVFVDSIHAELKDFREMNDEISFSVDVSRGAEEVEIVGSWLP